MMSLTLNHLTLVVASHVDRRCRRRKGFQHKWSNYYRHTPKLGHDPHTSVARHMQPPSPKIRDNRKLKLILLLTPQRRQHRQHLCICFTYSSCTGGFEKQQIRSVEHIVRSPRGIDTTQHCHQYHHQESPLRDTPRRTQPRRQKLRLAYSQAPAPRRSSIHCHQMS